MASHPEPDKIDVTDEVVALTEKLHAVVEGSKLPVVPLAIATMIGEAIADPVMLEGILTMIADIARAVHAENHSHQEGTMIQ